MTPLTPTGNQSKVFVMEGLTLLYLVPRPKRNLLANQTAVTFGSHKSINKTETNNVERKHDDFKTNVLRLTGLN